MLNKNIISKFVGLLFIMVISFGFVSQAHATVDVLYDYAKGIGGTGEDKGTRQTIDSSGNIYTIGYFNGTVDFDPSSSTSNLTSTSSSNTFITKFDSSGNFIWVKQIGGTGDDYTELISIDSTNNLYVSGRFQSTVDFDPSDGISNLTSAGGDDIFILKLDVDGNFIWAKRIGGTGNDYTDSIVVNNNNLYMTGGYVGTVDFDPSDGTSNLISSGSTDIFVTKFDLSGVLIWAKSFGTPGGAGWGDWVHDIAVDSNGNVYTTGAFGGSTSGRVADFDPGDGIANLTTVGNIDIFINKLDSNGNFVWVKGITGPDWDFGNSIKIDSNNNVYTTGSFIGTVSYNLGEAGMTSAGSDDFFLLKLDASGNLIYLKQMGSTGTDWAQAIGIDSINNVYTTGPFSGTVDFDLGAGVYNLTSFGGTDAFILKLDSSGNFVYAKQYGGSGDDRGNDIVINPSNGYMYNTGYFTGTSDFDPSAGIVNLTSAGDKDIFISRLIPDIVAPTFSSITSSNLANTTSTITWTTNENSSSIVEYGTTTSYGATTTESDTGAGTTSHTVNLTDLTGCTTYHYRVKSNDPSANLGTSGDNTFTTPGCAPPPIWLLQAMSDRLRAEQNQTPVYTPPTNTIVLCEQGQLFSTTTGQKCTSFSNTNDQTNIPIDTSKYLFTKNLKYKDNNTDVRELQKFLNIHNFLISTTGPGSIGNETNYFGPATRSALIKYQKANNINPAVGYFGVITRGVVNK